MMDDLLDLLNAIETKRNQLNKFALSKVLTSKEVVKSSRELDKLLNIYLLKKQENANKL